VARKAGLSLAQDTTIIETAIMGALEEIGVHLTIAEAVKSKTKTIAASSNYITWAEEYSRLASVTYQYSSGSSTYKRPLTKQDITEYEIDNAGLQSQVSDMVTRYCVRGDRIYVGPGNVQTGGSIIIYYQRKLVPDDIEKLPDSYMVVNGGLSNVLPVENPAQDVFRRMFMRALEPAAVASTPVKERHDRIRMSDQLRRDQAYLDSL